MGPTDALYALDLLRPKLTVPMHYNTFPNIRVDPTAFARDAGTAGHRVRVLNPGDQFEI